MRLASIDIGTNTLLLLICETEKQKITKVLVDEHKIARLGEDLNETGFISENAFARASSILRDYRSILDELNVDKTICVATSAMRDAKNSNEIKQGLESIIKESIQIIGGDNEAELSFIGSIEGFDRSSVIDIGGGSTEIIFGSSDNISFKRSVDIGAVRITEMFDLFSKRKDNIEKALSHIKKVLSIFPTSNDHIAIAVAGTPTTVAQIKLDIKKFDPNKVHMEKVDLYDLERVKNIIIEKSKEDLISKFDVHPNRADVILGGLLILESYMNVLEFDHYYTSIRGLRYGVIIDHLRKN